MALTHRELAILMKAQVERIYDDYDRMADSAMMRERAHRDKRPRRNDLFKRPVDEVAAQRKAEEMAERAAQQAQFLAQFGLK